MAWTVTNTKKVDKALKKLPIYVGEIMKALSADIELSGPVRGNWPNFSKLGGERHHCHLRKGRPTYVAVWEERNETINLVEVTYVGTHEKAPY